MDTRLETSTEIEETRTRLELVRAQIATLQQEERTLEMKLQSLVHAIAPIHRVPQDILREVFFWTLPTPQELVYSTDSLSIRHQTFPMRLGRVCKHWKRVSEDYALLWSSLRILIAKLPEDRESNLPFVAQHRPLIPCGRQSLSTGISNCLARWDSITKASPLQLQLISADSSVSCHWAPSVFSALGNSTFQRITQLSLCETPYSAIVEVPPGSLPALQSLVLRISGIASMSGPSPVKAFRDCPQLCRAAVEVVGDKYEEDVLVELPWRQLTHLIVMGSIPPRLYRKHLSHCRHLKYFLLTVPAVPEIDDWIDWGPDLDEPSVERFQWPSLTSLTLSWYEVQDEGVKEDHFFIDAVNPTSVRSLRLLGDQWEVISDPRTLLGWITSMNSLQYLSLSYEDLPIDAFVAILKATPHLTTLDIQLSDWVPPEFCDPFLPMSQDPGLLPNLSKLVVEVTPNWNSCFNMSTFLEFVQHRMDPSGPGTPLTHICILLSPALGYSDPSEPLNFRALEDYREAGLSVEIHAHGKDQRAIRHERWWWVDRDPVLVEEWPEARELFAQPYLKFLCPSRSEYQWR